MVHHLAEAHSPGYSLMQQSDCCRRTEESTTLDPQWFHHFLPKLQLHMQSSLEGYPHSITGMSPQLKILQQSQKVRQHPTTTQVDPLPCDEALI